jgi:hypothetical protein
MNKPTRHTFLRTLLVALLLGGLASCSPYANVNVGVPFKVGPVYVNPSIGVGGIL